MICLSEMKYTNIWRKQKFLKLQDIGDIFVLILKISYRVISVTQTHNPNSTDIFSHMLGELVASPEICLSTERLFSSRTDFHISVPPLSPTIPYHQSQPCDTTHWDIRISVDRKLLGHELAVLLLVKILTRKCKFHSWSTLILLSFLHIMLDILHWKKIQNGDTHKILRWTKGKLHEIHTVYATLHNFACLICTYHYTLIFRTATVSL